MVRVSSGWWAADPLPHLTPSLLRRYEGEEMHKTCRLVFVARIHTFCSFPDNQALLHRFIFSHFSPLFQYPTLYAAHFFPELIYRQAFLALPLPFSEIWVMSSEYAPSMRVLKKPPYTEDGSPQ